MADARDARAAELLNGAEILGGLRPPRTPLRCAPLGADTRVLRTQRLPRRGFRSSRAPLEAHRSDIDHWFTVEDVLNSDDVRQQIFELLAI
jgi:hypothetical protein